MVNRSNNDTIKLGDVKLPWSNDTYRSCRALCKKEYPSFQFYQKFIKYESCECMKMKNGNDVRIKTHGAYTFGYSNDCGKDLKTWVF